MPTLNDIRYDYLEALNNITVTPDGEVIGVEELEKLEGDIKDKIQGVVYYIEEVTALEAAIKGKIDAQKERLASLGKTKDRLKEYVAFALTSTGLIDEKHKKYDTADFCLSVKPSEETVISDKTLIPHEWCNLKTYEPTYEPDKARIKAAIKAGEVIPGATIKYKQNLQIK